jgi:hypothetical protein
MSKRLQVVLDDAELAEIRRSADAEGVTVSEWVRQVLRRARRDTPRQDAQRRLAAVESAMSHSFPTGDVDQMLREIEQGYHST